MTPVRVSDNETTHSIAARCLDRYFAERVKEVEGKEDVDIDPRLTAIVESMLDR